MTAGRHGGIRFLQLIVFSALLGLLITYTPQLEDGLKKGVFTSLIQLQHQAHVQATRPAIKRVPVVDYVTN
jgi:hypothetical protein